MYEYEYVRVQNHDFVGSSFEDCQEIINEYARKGYRFVGCLPAVYLRVLERFDLVFEREVEA